MGLETCSDLAVDLREIEAIPAQPNQEVPRTAQAALNAVRRQRLMEEKTLVLIDDRPERIVFRGLAAGDVSEHLSALH